MAVSTAFALDPGDREADLEAPADSLCPRRHRYGSAALRPQDTRLHDARQFDRACRLRVEGFAWQTSGVSPRRTRTTGLLRRPKFAATVASTCSRRSQSEDAGWCEASSAARRAARSLCRAARCRPPPTARRSGAASLRRATATWRLHLSNRPVQGHQSGGSAPRAHQLVVLILGRPSGWIDLQPARRLRSALHSARVRICFLSAWYRLDGRRQERDNDFGFKDWAPPPAACRIGLALGLDWPGYTPATGPMTGDIATTC